MNENEVKNITKDFRDIFCNNKKKQTCELLNLYEGITCECMHKSRIQEVQGRITWFQRMVCFYQLVLAFFGLIITLAAYGFWLSSQYTRSTIYSTCATSFFWPYTSCPLAY
ncbi:uncharacterized protein LOC106085714 [Stomoxys calcitrans]|uniref:Uncharacterized protein n=1 Tax=Stomoxys calcitrans TaxID=35570 RepID=A0A1I8Q0A5_STOCA|nr:uncharacterized protein LOC106085714 [Stomoxys calcitrans]